MAVDLDSMAENAERIWEESILPSLGEFIEIHALSPMFEPNWDELGELQATIDVCLVIYLMLRFTNSITLCFLSLNTLWVQCTPYNW